jgi:hypothetical protein
VCILATIKELGTAAIVIVKLTVGIIGSGFVSLSQISRCKLSYIYLFIGVN